MTRRSMTAAFLCTLLCASAALASWYDDYDAGLNAIRKGQWQLAVQKMNAAIAGNPKENDKTRTYGAIFINYHPYYYRGVAYLNSGKYEQAISDLEKTSGPGEENLGSISELIQRAKTKLAEASAPPPSTEPTRPAVTPAVTTQAPVPAVDNALRNRARAALDQAKGRLQAAQQRNATGTQTYQDAVRQWGDANNRLANARSNDDLNAIIAAAETVTMLADSAAAPAVATARPPATTVPPVTSKATSATQSVLGDTNRRLRVALEAYFNGDFDRAERGFRDLTRDLPRNGWIWAFLGASQYSQYAFEGEDDYKASAMDSFRKARAYGKWKNGLPEKYFSRKIRKAFLATAG